MVAFLGLANAAAHARRGIAQCAHGASAPTRSVPQGEGTRLRYVNCPQSPFNGSSAAECLRGHLIARAVRCCARGARRAVLGAAGARAAPGSRASGRAAAVPRRRRFRRTAATACRCWSATLDVYDEPQRAARRSSRNCRRARRSRRWSGATRGTGSRCPTAAPAGSTTCVGKTGPNFSVDAAPRASCAQRRRPRVAAVPPDATARRECPRIASCSGSRWAKPLEALIPTIDPTQVPPPQALLPRESIPVPDRWRLMDQLGLIHQRWYDPYNPNTLKGDRPVFGEDWFVNVGVVSDTLFEWRQVPTPIGAQSTQHPQSDDQFGGSRQSLFNQNVILSLSLIKGDTTFRPPDYEFRFVPVINFNRTQVDEVRVLRRRPARGHDAQRQHRRRAGTVRRQAPAQRVRALRLRRHPRRHPAVHRRLPRPPVHRPAARHPALRHARQQPVAVQPGLVPPPGEGHQQRLERHRQAAAQRGHLRRQPLPAGLSGARASRCRGR